MKLNKFLKVIIMFLIVFESIMPIVFASNPNFDVNYENSSGIPDKLENLTNNTLGTAISIARIVGVVIAIVILTVIGCRYMIAAPGDRADIKKHAIPFVIGAVVLFGATGILDIIVNVAESIQ